MSVDHKHLVFNMNGYCLTFIFGKLISNIRHKLETSFLR